MVKFFLGHMSLQSVSLKQLLRFDDDDDEPVVRAPVASPQTIVDAYDNEMMGSIGDEIGVKQEVVAVPQAPPPPRRVSKRPLEPATEVLIPTMVGEDPRVTSIVDLSNAGNAARLYRNYLQNIGRNMDEVIARIPKDTELMAHLVAMENPDQPFGFMELMKTPISMGLEMPRLEVVSFEYNAEFLNPPDKGKPWERPCKPLINEETGLPFVCESVAMGGAVLREYLLPSQLSALMQSSFFQQGGGTALKKTINLPQLQRCCYLCSQRSHTNAFAQKRLPNEDPSAAAAAPTDGVAAAAAEYVIIHDYIHAVACNGGYNPLHMLPAFKQFYGVVGPLIEHDRNHYILTKNGGWIQKDTLRFRDGAMMLH